LSRIRIAHAALSLLLSAFLYSRAQEAPEPPVFLG